MSMDKFRDKKMHIDGIKEINNVDDYEVHLIKNPEQKKLRYIHTMNQKNFN